ncbi:WD40 repeat domain-containing protein [Kitasatospora sp. NPDC059571]|uniref:WD40 repeat domain-containing protein n=1 Tax=Kitasatospora sp. NPDC059571 TaxID=3346871 RepID=UPI0036ABF408
MFFETAWTSVAPRTELAILEGHTDRVRDVCPVEAAGRTLLASAGADATVRIWDPAGGEPVRTLHGHTGGVTAVCSTAGLLISAGDDRTVRVWDPGTGRQLRVMAGYRGASPVEVEGRAMVASTTEDGTALWDPVTGQVRQVFRGAGAELSAVRADGRTLVVARAEGAGPGVWDLATGERCWQQRPDAHTSTGVCAVTTGRRVLVAGAGYDKELEGGRIRLWDPVTGRLVRTIEFEPLVEGVLDRVRGVRPLDLDGRQLLLGIGQKTVRVFDPATGARLRAFVVPSDWVESLCVLSLDGRPALAVSERYRDTIWLWDPATGRQLTGVPCEKGWIDTLCAFESGGRTLLAGADGLGRTVRVWDPTAGGPPARHDGHPDEVLGVWPVGDRMISIAAATARIWDPATGERLRTIRGSLFGIADVAELTVDGRPLLAGAFSTYDAGCIRLWDPATGRQVRRLQRRWEEGPTVLCPFTRDGRVLLAAGDESDVRVWDPGTGRLEQETPCGEDVSWLGRVLVEGRPVLVGHHREHGLRIWDPAAAAWQPAPDGLGSGFADGGHAFVLEGRPLVADTDRHGTVHVRDLLTGETRCVLRGHTGQEITGIRVMTVGTRTLLVTSGGTDRTVRLWDPDSGQCALTVPVHHEVVGSAPVGDGLLAVAAPSGVLVYRIRTG